jgi:hypothetical protein
VIVCHDEPIDHDDAIVADDALLDAIARGDSEAMRAALGLEPDELLKVLRALAASVIVTHLVSANRSDLTECCRRPLTELSEIDYVTDEESAATCPEMRP